MDRTQVWIGRADPMSAGSAYGLVASAVRNGVGLDAALAGLAPKPSQGDLVDKAS